MITNTRELIAPAPNPRKERHGHINPPTNPSPHPPKLPQNLLLGEPPRLPPQHGRNLPLAHPDLITHRHQTRRQAHVILPQQRDGHHDVVDILEGQGAAFGVLGFGFDEGEGVVAPVPAGVEVVGGVVAVVEAVAVGLRGGVLARGGGTVRCLRGGCLNRQGGKEKGIAHRDVDQGYTGSEVGIRVHLVD